MRHYTLMFCILISYVCASFPILGDWCTQRSFSVPTPVAKKKPLQPVEIKYGKWRLIWSGTDREMILSDFDPKDVIPVKIQAERGYLTGKYRWIGKDAVWEGSFGWNKEDRVFAVLERYKRDDGTWSSWYYWFVKLDAKGEGISQGDANLYHAPWADDTKIKIHKQEK